MGSRYSKYLCDSLKGRLAELSSESDGQRMSLADEVDLARMVMDKAVRLFAITHDDNASEEQQKRITPDMKMAAQAGLSSALEQVSRLVERFAKVSTLSREFLDMRQVDFILRQVVAIIEKHVSDEEVRTKIATDLDAIDVPKDLSTQAKVTFAFSDTG